jgi:hypothetical protein
MLLFPLRVTRRFSRHGNRRRPAGRRQSRRCAVVDSIGQILKSPNGDGLVAGLHRNSAYRFRRAADVFSVRHIRGI